MQPATRWLTLNGKPFPKPMHVCAEENCLYVYELPQGYHELSESEPIGRPIAGTAIRRTLASNRRTILGYLE